MFSLLQPLRQPFRTTATRAMSTYNFSKTENLQASKLFDLSGWTTVVTGGGTGIGLMCAQTLVANGAKVYITGRRMEALEAAANTHGQGKMIPIQADIISKESINKLFQEIEKKEDKLHLLINNAGIAGTTRTVEKGQESAEALSEELWKDDFDVWETVYKTNVVGAHFCAVRALPLLRKSTLTEPGFSSSIINITSISGITKMSQHHLPYNASKAAAIQLTEMLAQEFAEGGVKVRVNSVAPGIFPSEMTAHESGSDQKSSIDASGYKEKKGIPAGRPGNERDMAQTILDCACNQYMNGETVRVDGGYLLKKP